MNIYCPTCEADMEFRQVTLQESYNVGGKYIQVTAKLNQCLKCGSTHMGEKETQELLDQLTID